MNKRRWQKVLHAIGPGFITGAADDDPSGIATYSQTGVLFGFNQLWVVLFSYPFMTIVQEMCGRIGLITGKGLAGVIRKHYPRSILMGAIALLLVANVVNIGADLGAMASSIQLLVPVPFWVLLVIVTFFTLGLEVYVPYPSYARILKYLTLSLLAYVAVALVVVSDWGAVLQSIFTPHIEFTRTYVMNLAAFLGTTISPYLFFWQADEEVEEELEAHKIRRMGKGVPKVGKGDLERMRIDTSFGMLFSNLITFFIIVSVATTIGRAGITSIATASDAALALKPVAGQFAFLLFTIGILGTGMLAVPVLAGSAGYAVAESLGWNESLGLRFSKAPGFYGIIVAATLIGLVVNIVSIPPMMMLYYAAIANGVLAPPLMLLLLFIANDKRILGKYVNSRISNWLGVFITAGMGVVAVALLWTLFV